MDLKKQTLDSLCVNAIRALSIDAVQKAKSGHPGLPLDAAPMAYVLWTRYLNHNPKNPKWYNRDRFVLSAGHGSMLLYSLLHLTGYAVSLEEIRQFRQWGSITPGHPESFLTPGVEVCTGPLGQGFANGVGMAIGEAYLAARYNREGFNITDHYTYGLISDGDLMEGVSCEAASLAGHLKLGKLIYLYDNNHMTLAGSTQLNFTEDKVMRFAAYGWHTEVVEDGNDLLAIDQAIKTAREEQERPSLILVRTYIGYGSPNKQDTFEAHGSPLGEEEVKLTKQQLGWPVEPTFYIPKEVDKHFKKAIDQGLEKEQLWKHLFEVYSQQYPAVANELLQLMNGELPANWNENIPYFPADYKGMATRVANGKIMQAISPFLPGLIGGSADLNSSTLTALKEQGNFQNPHREHGDLQGAEKGQWSYQGRNLFYGVREHAMGAISTGLATFEGLIPYTATFLTFSDYMRPPMRLAALSNFKVIFIFTHDSIGLGEDGPTHQPIEQLANLRAIPEFIVIRPADANETAVAWQVAIEMKNHPIALILTRQDVPTLDRKKYAAAQGLRYGAYILADPPDGKSPDIILIATGSEVSLIVGAQERLQKEGIAVRTVSMPSWELFDAQPDAYKQQVLPKHFHKRLAVEAGVRQGWDKYIGEEGDMIAVDKFGASAPGKITFEKYGFTVEHVHKKALELLEERRQ